MIVAEQQVSRLNVKDKILFTLILLFFVFILLQYNDWITGVFTGGLLLYCILYNSPHEKWQLLKQRKYIIWMVLFFAWIFISVITSTDVYEGFRFLDPRLPLLYFPITLGLIQLSRTLKEKILLGIAIVITFYCVACLAWGISNYSRTGNADLLYNDSLTDLTQQQSTYISMLVNLSIYIYARFIFYKKPRYKGLLIAAMLFLFGISYLLASRIMMFVLYLAVAVFVAYYILKEKKYLQGAVLVMALLAGGFLVYTFFPKTINRFKDIVYTNFEYNRQASESHYSAETTADQWNGANFRMAAWQCGWEMFRKNPVTGTGLGDKKNDLIKKYKEKNFQFAIETKKNLHNNYLDILVGTGVIGLFLFLTGWYLLPLSRAFVFKDYLSVLIILTFAAAMVSEVYFDRTLGGLSFGFIAILVNLDKNSVAV